MIRTETWRGFRLHQSFQTLEQGARYPFEEAASRSQRTA
jgi:hypothetical protein